MDERYLRTEAAMNEAIDVLERLSAGEDLVRTGDVDRVAADLLDAREGVRGLARESEGRDPNS